MTHGVLTRIKEFLDTHVHAEHADTMKALRQVRDALHVEVRGMSEYIHMDGRIYRYGFVSADMDHTEQLVKKVVTPGKFKIVFDMDIQDIAGLKAHLLTHQLADAQALLPAPVVMDPSTLAWLKCAYTHVTRLNQHWGTAFKTWDQVRVEEAQDILMDLTSQDIHAVTSNLDRLTRVLLKNPPPSNLQWDEDQLAKTIERFRGVHGPHEVVFAALATQTPNSTDAIYMLFLKYSAHALDTNTFAQLPPGKHAKPDKQFIIDYNHDSNLPAWVNPTLPVTTTPTARDFQTLVDMVNK